MPNPILPKDDRKADPTVHSRLQLFANAAIAASRVSAQPCVGVRSSWCPKARVHTSRAAFNLEVTSEHMRG